MSAMEGWHVDKRVSVGHIVTTLVVAVSLVVWMGRVESRTELNATAIQALADRVERDDRRQELLVTEIKNSLIRIEAKLDQKVDK